MDIVVRKWQIQMQTNVNTMTWCQNGDKPFRTPIRTQRLWRIIALLYEMHIRHLHLEQTNEWFFSCEKYKYSADVFTIELWEYILKV